MQEKWLVRKFVFQAFNKIADFVSYFTKINRAEEETLIKINKAQRSNFLPTFCFIVKD